MMRKRIGRIIAGVLVAGSVGCAKPKRVRIPVTGALCERSVLAKSAVNIKTRSFEPETWYSLLLANYVPGSGKTLGRPQHCNGEIVAVAPFPVSLDCAQGPFLGRKVVRDSDLLTPDRLVRQQLTENEELVWLQTHVDENDDALGPLARLIWSQQTVRVVPLGTLAAHRNGVQLRMVGETRSLLAVESDRCGKKPGSGCVRELRVRVFKDGQFQNLPMVGEHHQCMGEFAFHLEEGRRVKVGHLQEEQYDVTRSLQDLAPDGLAIVEVIHAKRFARGSSSSVAGSWFEPETSSRRRRLEVRDDHVFVQPGAMEELARMYPVPRPAKQRAKGRNRSQMAR